MAESHVLSGLVAKYQEVSGEIANHQEQIKNLQQSLVNLKGAIKIFAPEYDLRSIQSKRLYQKTKLFAHGEVQRRVLEVLRDVSQPCSSRMIADQVLLDKEIELTDEVVLDTQKRAIAALRSLEKRGLVKQSGTGGSALLWQLA